MVEVDGDSEAGDMNNSKVDAEATGRGVAVNGAPIGVTGEDMARAVGLCTAGILRCLMCGEEWYRGIGALTLLSDEDDDCWDTLDVVRDIADDSVAVL